MKSENLILLVVNPIAGNTEKEHIIDSVRSEVLSKNQRLLVYQTSGVNDKDTIEQLIRKDKPSRVLVAGGDGTISMVSQCIRQKNICLGILPAGSANGMAVNIGLPEMLSEQIAVALSNNILKADVVVINNNPCLHIADLGINAELVKNYEKSTIRGKLGYFLQSLPTLLNSESPFEFTIETDEGITTETGILLAVANANKFGTGANINPNGKINDGKFEILVFKNLDFIEILKTAQDSPELSPDFVRIISTDKAKIINKTMVPFQIDGEFMGEIQNVDVSIEPQSLSLVVPQAFINLQQPKHYI